MNDPTLSEDMKSIFHVQSEARRIQFLGFSKEELKKYSTVCGFRKYIYGKKFYQGKKLF